MPLIRNKSNSPQCVSDINVTFHGAEDKFGAHVKAVSDEQLQNSMGLQTLIYREILEVVSTEQMAEEAADRARRAEALDAERAEVGIVEDQGQELVPDGKGGWLDPGAPQAEKPAHFEGGQELPKTDQPDGGMIDPRSAQSDPSQKLGDFDYSVRDGP